MQIFIDDQESTNRPQPNATVEDILASIRVENAQTDRAILAVACDGIDLGGQSVEEVLQSPAAAYDRIEVQTGDPSRMIGDALDDALVALEAVDESRAEVIARFAAGKTGPAMNMLSDCISQWHHVNTAITQSLSLLNNLSAVPPEESAKLAAMLQPVQDRLNDVRDAIVRKDFVSLADILEYEFADVSTCWRNVINAIQIQIHGRTKSAGS